MYITALTLSTMFLTFSSVEFMVICPCNHPANYCRDFSAANYPFDDIIPSGYRLANASAILFS